MALKATIYAGMAGTFTPAVTPELGQTVEQRFPKEADVNIESGVGDYQGDIFWADERTVNAATNDDIDLAGVLSSVYGSLVTFVEIVSILIYSKKGAGNTTNLTVGNATTNAALLWFGAAAHTIQIQPEGRLLQIAPKAGWGVTAGTGDILRIANAAGNAHTYAIKIIGRLS